MIKEETAAEFLHRLGIDAKLWTEEFLKISDEGKNDFGTMISWFANAIMAGYDTAANKKQKEFEKALEVIRAVVEDKPYHVKQAREFLKSIEAEK